MPSKAEFRHTFRVGGRAIGRRAPVLIVGEAGVNHFGKLDMAKQLVDMAKDAGCDAVKFQVYKTEELISRHAAPEWFDRMKAKELPFTAFIELKRYCRRKSILFFATAHDAESLRFLDTLGLELYKIGSGEVGNLQFLREVASRKKPVFFSIGMYKKKEIEDALAVFRNAGNDRVVLMHCVTAYPAEASTLNLRCIQMFSERYRILVGYSDHTQGNYAAFAAVTQGACVIEKHITIRKNVRNAQDWKVSCDAQSLRELVRGIRFIESALGGLEKPLSPAELNSRMWARKSLVARTFIPAGTRIVPDMISCKRPGTGIPPHLLHKVIGRVAARDIKQDELIGSDPVLS